MTTINRLSALDSISGGYQLPFYATDFGDPRRGSVTLLQEYMQDNLNFGPEGKPEFVTQTAVPTGDFTLQVSDNDDNTWLIINPTAPVTNGTITLPAIGNVVDHQEMLSNTTQAVTNLTVDGNGAVAVVGAPATLAQFEFFKLKYDAGSQNWYRIG